MDNMGCTVGLLGSMRSEEEEKQMMEEYHRRKKNADRIENALMTACGEIAYRLEKKAQGMSTEELSRSIGALAGIATTMGALTLYAAKPYTSSCE